VLCSKAPPLLLCSWCRWWWEGLLLLGGAQEWDAGLCWGGAWGQPSCSGPLACWVSWRWGCCRACLGEGGTTVWSGPEYAAMLKVLGGCVSSEGHLPSAVGAGAVGLGSCGVPVGCSPALGSPPISSGAVNPASEGIRLPYALCMLPPLPPLPKASSSLEWTSWSESWLSIVSSPLLLTSTLPSVLCALSIVHVPPSKSRLLLLHPMLCVHAAAAMVALPSSPPPAATTAAAGAAPALKDERFGSTPSPLLPASAVEASPSAAAVDWSVGLAIWMAPNS
jgi:hypothetical protein